MATPAQIAANRANAQKSTGPRTEAGKTTCRNNPTRHGLCRFIHCMDDEEVQEMRALLADLMEELQPQTPTEEILVNKIAEQFWLNKRASCYLAGETFNNQHCSRKAEPGTRAQVALYLRYYTTADRAFNKNLQDLRKLQKERHDREALAQVLPPESVAEEIGSVPQNAEPPDAGHPPQPQPSPLRSESPVPFPVIEPQSAPPKPPSNPPATPGHNSKPPEISCTVTRATAQPAVNALQKQAA